MCVHLYTMMYMRDSEDSLQKQALTSHHRGWRWSEVISLGGKCLSSLSCLVGPWIFKIRSDK